MMITSGLALVKVGIVSGKGLKALTLIPEKEVHLLKKLD